jgi:tetratricopeptide (TPR) repeat protein
MSMTAHMNKYVILASLAPILNIILLLDPYDSSSEERSEVLRRVTVKVEVVDKSGTIKARGTGVILSPSGHILTSNHVLIKGDVESTIQVRMVDDNFLLKTPYTATVIKQDPQIDLAVIYLAATGLPFLKVGSSSLFPFGGKIEAYGFTVDSQQVSIEYGHRSNNSWDTGLNVDRGFSGAPVVAENCDLLIGVLSAPEGPHVSRSAVSGYRIIPSEHIGHLLALAGNKSVGAVCMDDRHITSEFEEHLTDQEKALVASAEQDYDAKRYKAGAKTIQSLVQKHPNNLFLRFKLGLFLSFIEGHKPDAVKEFLFLLDRDPDNLGARNNLVFTLYDLDRKDAAEYHAKELLKREANNAPMKMFLGMIFTEKQDYRSAEEFYSKLIAEDNDYVEWAYLKRALVILTRDQQSGVEGAVDDLLKGLDKSQAISWQNAKTYIDNVCEELGASSLSQLKLQNDARLKGGILRAANKLKIKAHCFTNQSGKTNKQRKGQK